MYRAEAHGSDIAKIGRETIIHATRSAQGPVSRYPEGTSQRTQGVRFETATHFLCLPRSSCASQHRPCVFTLLLVTSLGKGLHAICSIDAVLAVQNMQASGTVTQDIEFKALEGSLSMMSKVLNDVLDLCVLSPLGSLMACSLRQLTSLLSF